MRAKKKKITIIRKMHFIESAGGRVGEGGALEGRVCKQHVGFASVFDLWIQQSQNLVD